MNPKQPPIPHASQGYQGMRQGLYFLVGMLLLGLVFAHKATSNHASSAAAAVSPITPSVSLTSPSSAENTSPTPSTALSSSPTTLFPAPRNFPAQDTFAIQNQKWTTDYSVDDHLQSSAQVFLNQFRPDDAVLAVCDLRTGVIRTLAERDSAGVHSHPRMAFEATFPAASLIKILTASAALEGKCALPMDSLPLLGRNHTLYKFQLLPPKRAHFAKISLENAFARSVNPVFGGLGLRIGADALRKMGSALGFNQPQSLSNCSPSHLDIPDTGFGLAQVACGYTKSTTISPLHALRIARGIGDDGHLTPLSFTPDLRNIKDGRRMITSVPASEPIMSATALNDLRTLMAATVESGTAKKGFHRAFRYTANHLEDLDLGGKTGTLDGTEPAGHYEWYIGYAKHKDQPDDGIAVAVMVINQRRTVHASELAALLIREWANPGVLTATPSIEGKRISKRHRRYYARS